MVLLFWACFGLIAYTYLIYPGLVILFSNLFPRRVKVEGDHFPFVSMVIAAHNEEEILEEKIQNCLALNYPPERIEFLIGSDGSDDGTNSILQEASDPRIKPFIYPQRRGKSAVLNELVPEAEGKIVVLSDANSLYASDAVNKLIPYFKDPSIGGVCGKLELINPTGSPGGEGEGLYWRFENRIKEAEGALHSLISANGAIFAIKRDLFKPLPTKVPLNDDFMVTLQILAQRKRVIYEPEAIAAERTSPDMESEFVRKIRISSLNFNALPQMIKNIKDMRTLPALALFSHKFLRWMVPFLGLGVLISNLFLFGQGVFYAGFLAFQGVLFLGAIVGFIGDRLFNRSGPFVPFYYLAMVNIAIIVGLWRSLTGIQPKAWQRVHH